jgi:hypothetical protein
MGSNWGCYPPCEVEKIGRLSAYPLGYNLFLKYESTNLYSKNSKHTQHDSGPSPQAPVMMLLFQFLHAKNENDYVQ